MGKELADAGEIRQSQQGYTAEGDAANFQEGAIKIPTDSGIDAEAIAEVEQGNIELSKGLAEEEEEGEKEDEIAANPVSDSATNVENNPETKDSNTTDTIDQDIGNNNIDKFSETCVAEEEVKLKIVSSEVLPKQSSSLEDISKIEIEIENTEHFELSDVVLENSFHVTAVESEQIFTNMEMKTVAIEDVIMEEIKEDPDLQIEQIVDMDVEEAAEAYMEKNSESLDTCREFLPSIVTAIESITISTSFSASEDVKDAVIIRPMSQEDHVDVVDSSASKDKDVSAARPTSKNSITLEDRPASNSDETSTDRLMSKDALADASTTKQDAAATVRPTDDISLSTSPTAEADDITKPISETDDEKIGVISAEVPRFEHDQVSADDQVAADTILNSTKDCSTLENENITNEDVFLNDESAIRRITDSLSRGKFLDAIEALRNYRSNSGIDETDFEDNERDALFALLAKTSVQNRTSIIAVSGSIESLADICDQLSECMAELLAVICCISDKKC